MKHDQRIVASSDAVRRRMSLAPSENTGPELALRSELHRRGLRFRLHRHTPFDRRRRIDIAFPKSQVAVFIDGCFWHYCEEHAVLPKANAAFWESKLTANRERDHDTNSRLAECGWTVVRVWEHEGITAAADRVEAAVRSRTP